MAVTSATRVLLVFPRFNPNSFWSLTATCDAARAKAPAPPLGLLTIAAMFPESWEPKLVNRNFQELTPADLAWADLVMTGGMLPQEPDTLTVMRLCREAGVPVAVGGPAPTSTPDVYEEADILVIGEAEGIFGDVVAAWERGERRGRFTAPKFQADVTTSPIPRFDLLDFSDYLYIGVQFSRGCPFTCEFCDIIELYGRAPRTKTVPQMLGELDRLYELGYRGHVDFVDDNLIGNKKAVRLFLPHLIAWQERRGHPFQFSTEASLNLADDADLLALLSRAGFFLVFCGIESPDEETLVHMSKKQNTRRSLSASVERIYEAGILVTAGFIVGFDTERDSVSAALSRCISDLAIPMAVVGMLTALPNTQLWRRLHKEGRLYGTFSHLRDDAGDASTGGLNFRTLRDRRGVLQDHRDTIEAVYAPDAYFERVRRQGRMIKRPSRPGAKIHWRLARKNLWTFCRVAWGMTARHPELARHYWGTVYDCLRHNPRAIEAVLLNVAVYLHHYGFSRFVVAEIDRNIEALESGAWIEPDVMPPDRTTGPKHFAAA